MRKMTSRVEDPANRKLGEQATRGDARSRRFRLVPAERSFSRHVRGREIGNVTEPSSGSAMTRINLVRAPIPDRPPRPAGSQDLGWSSWFIGWSKRGYGGWSRDGGKRDRRNRANVSPRNFGLGSAIRDGARRFAAPARIGRTTSPSLLSSGQTEGLRT